MSKIEWTDLTWNPATGCSWISPACDNCYARPMANRMKGNPKMKGKYRNGFKVTYHPEELERKFPGKNKKIFICSMGDLFHRDVPFSFIWRVFKVIRNNPQHIFQILTKRPGRALTFFRKFDVEFMPKNVWIGVTVENRKELHRISVLRDMPKAVKFVSFEPLLEDMGTPDLSGIDWVIVGAETGPGARSMNPDWARSIRDECKNFNIPFFFKQMSKKSEIPDDLMIKEFPNI